MYSQRTDSCFILNSQIVSEFQVIYCQLYGKGIMLERQFRVWLLKSLKDNRVSYTNYYLEDIHVLTPDTVSLVVPLMAPVMDNNALY